MKGQPNTREIVKALLDQTRSKTSKKDKQEKEDEEVTRLIKPSPKDKPPRTDKTRRVIKEDDADIDKKDKDLSMNYKDIGGSLSYLAQKVADTFARRNRLFIAEDEETEEVDRDDAKDDSKEDDDSTPEEDPKEESEGEKEPEGEEVLDDTEKEEEPEELEPRPADSEDIIQAAITLYEKPASDLHQMLMYEDLNDSEEAAVYIAFQFKTNPVPPSWKIKEVFDEGTIKLKQRHRFRKHMDNWDAKHFANNLNYIKEKHLNETLTENRSWYVHYYEKMIELIKDQWEEFRKEDFQPLQNLEEAFEGLENPDEKFNEESKKVLDVQTKEWQEKLRRTSQEKVKNLYNEVTKGLDTQKDYLTNKAAWLSSLHYLLKGSIEMKKNIINIDGEKVASAIRSGFSKASQYRGLPGPVDRDDPFAPIRTEWRLKRPLGLHEGDFALLVKEARAHLKKPFLADDLVGHDPDMANRIALDHAIHSFDEGRYANTIDAPTYDSLLVILKRVIS